MKSRANTGIVPGSWRDRERYAEGELGRAGYTVVTTGATPPKYFAYSDTLSPTPERESWQEVLGDVNAAAPIAFQLEPSSAFTR